MNETDQAAIAAECDEIKDMLLAKNRAYGNSALEPLRIFSRASSVEQLLVRIDDKLSRIRNIGIDASEGEDTVADLIGYLHLLRIACRRSTPRSDRAVERRDTRGAKEMFFEEKRDAV